MSPGIHMHEEFTLDINWRHWGWPSLKKNNFRVTRHDPHWQTVWDLHFGPLHVKLWRINRMQAR